MKNLEDLAEESALQSLKDIIMGYLLADLGASNLTILERRMKRTFDHLGTGGLSLTHMRFRNAVMELNSEGKLIFLSPSHIRLSPAYLRKIEGAI